MLSIRKESKPAMEKRRRARINESLSSLKLLVLGQVQRKSTKVCKLDKADILEMTVAYVNEVNNTGNSSDQLNCQNPTTVNQSGPWISNNSPSTPKIPNMSTVDRYRAGFNACADEIQHFLSGAAEVDAEIRMRILDHLANHVQNLFWIKFSGQSATSGESPGNHGLVGAVKLKQMMTERYQRQNRIKRCVQDQIIKKEVAKTVGEIMKQDAGKTKLVRRINKRHESSMKPDMSKEKGRRNTKLLLKELQTNNVKADNTQQKEHNENNIKQKIDDKGRNSFENAEVMWRPW